MGDKQLAFDMIMQEESPGWLHMVKNEFSTMGENLNSEGYGTGHHPFGANVSYWLYKHVLGLRPNEDGWKKMVLEPFLPNQLVSVSGTVHLPYGKISMALSIQDDLIKYQISIPFNTEASFIPMGDIKMASSAYKTNSKGQIVLPAGNYTFTSTY